MLVNEMRPEVKDAYNFLKNYCKEHDINEISELFRKNMLIEYVYQSDWDWSVKEEMECNNLSEDEAEKRTEEWFLSMNNQELFYDRICTYNQHSLILDKAEELGFISKKGIEQL